MLWIQIKYRHCQAKRIGLTQQTLKDDFKLHSDTYFGASSQDKEVTEVNVHPCLPPPCRLESISRQGPYQDSQSNIHALAVLAYRSGRPRIIVAGEVIKRLLSGKYCSDADLLSYDSKWVISIILLSTRRDTQSGALSVFARRAICSSEDHMFNLDGRDFL
ncbi:uncharacterized protein N7500_006650 [Penicillium coprophilum]|uniref:uncharacterized protein n=1 Tax=Penicillium coprophilum TaxID=36646 RepID=UPI002389A83B|nr:uncharacterized protein N7500_006650 [Penicillium coprophilum]KAJ5164820.1 hypothetical protein N7500_006650 [Penicillium coprophilum]